MLTRREILDQLKAMGIKEASLLKVYLRDIEKYMESNYGMVVGKTQRQKDERFDFRKDHFPP